MNDSLFWFVCMFIFLCLEMGHPGLLYFLAFSCGSCFSFIVSMFGLSFKMQFFVGLGSIIFALLVIHFFVHRIKHGLDSFAHKSNMDAFIGKKIIVYKSASDKNIWQAKIAGQIWTVRSVRDNILYEGVEVVIVDIRGCHLQVDVVGL